MARAMTREERQAASRREMRLTPRGKALITEHAEKHQLSKSEVMRWLVEQILQGKVSKPEPRTARITFWDPGRLVPRLTTKAAQAGVPVTALIDTAIEELLND